MKSLIVSIATAALFAGAISAAPAANTAYTGNWKIDYAKSTLTGDTFTYAVAPGAKFTYSNGSTDTYLFACDGKPYATIPGETITCPKAGPMGWRFTYATKGKTRSTETDTVSSNGKMLTIVNHQMYATGKTATETTLYTRVGAGVGTIGKWKSTKTHSSSPTTFTLTATPTTIDYEAKLSGTKVALKLDGTKSPIVGPGAPPGLFVVVKKATPAAFEFEEVVAGKVGYHATWGLSSDAKTLTWTSWATGKKAEATVAVYEKQ